MKHTWLFIIVVALLTIVSAWQLHPKGGQPSYVTSLSCRQCHENAYQSWSDTLHPTTFRRVENDNDILGDFTSNDPVLTFTKDEIEYVVGSRWEQIYVRKIDGEYYPFPARWYVKQNIWSPYKVDSCRQTPMSKKCNGCHTTGFNPETYEFSEFGVGCEACHGPGSRHVANRKKLSSSICRLCHWDKSTTETDIIRSVSSTVCGQCHNRGKSQPFSEQESPVFDFPVKNTPGGDLPESFQALSPADDKTNKYWWGNGVAKARHLEFADWGKSNHAKALTRLKQNHSIETGLPGVECLECHSTDYLFANNDAKPIVRTAKYGITCVACHNPHKLLGKGKSERKRNEPCIDCHTSKNSKCTQQTESIHFPCPQDKVECVDCHMPYVVKSGGWNAIRGHAFIILSPLENNALDMPNSCQNGACHQDRSQQWVQQEYRSFYKNSSGKN